ncbi:MAG TPA: flagellar hook-length control protein FliK [Candidatus Elarobacter sp.]|nr:flagellar hook-length control protein FliK [Candidatus Elarobacter sp.]
MRPSRTDRASKRGGEPLNAVPAANLRVSNAAPAAAHAGGLTALEGALFKSQLGDTLAARTATTAAVSPTTTAAATAATTAASPAVVALTRAVKAKLDDGTPLGDVVESLASSLAGAVAAQLGISPQAAQQRLTDVFRQALQPNDTGPPESSAERASALVTRFRQIAELATRVTNGDQGQPIRTIAGHSSDAVTAKANPAPDTDDILRDAANALATSVTASTSPASPAPAAAATSTAPRTAANGATGDGRAVALGSLPALATGGDTALGRALARAVLADPSAAPAAPVAEPILGPSHHVIAGPPAAAPPLAGTSSGDPAADAFVTAFASALARADGSTDRRGIDPAPANAAAPSPVAGSPSAAATATTVTNPSAASFAPTAVHDAAPIVPPAPAPPLPQPQHADANAVIDQVLRGMTIRTGDGTSQVRLRLVPEQLGDVSVKLVVSGGSVDASITAHSAGTQNALAGAQTQLAKSLAEAGLKLQSFSVGLAGSSSDTRDQSRPNDQPAKPATRRIGAVEAAEADVPADPSLLAIPSFGPPIYAADPALGALNYLV